MENKEVINNDKEFLNWIYERMICVHGEKDLYDYMINFKSIIDRSGSVAAPKPDDNDKSWIYEQYNLTHDQVRDNEISLLYEKWNKTASELAAAKESIKELLTIAEIYRDVMDRDKRDDYDPGSMLTPTISRAKALLDKQ